MGKRVKKTASEFVTTCVRVRPLSKREQNYGTQSTVQCTPASVVVTDDASGKSKTYRCTKSFDENADNAKIYKDVGSKMLQQLWEGYNVSVVTYGSTASGKSHTLFGEEADPGLQPRILEKLFRKIETAKDDGDEYEYHIEVSVLECYNEKIRDLLRPDTDPEKDPIQVHDDPNDTTFAAGATRSVVTSMDEMTLTLDEAYTARSLAAIRQNIVASRAHLFTIFTLIKHQFNDTTEKTDSVVSTLCIADIAGAENKKDGVRDGHHINLSLTTLVQCIKEKSKGSETAPFRDSIVSWLLKPAIGGNSKTYFFSCVSPSTLELPVTMAVCKITEKAGLVESKPLVNKNAIDKSKHLLKERIKEVEDSIREVETKVSLGGGPAEQMELDSLKVDKKIFSDMLKHINTDFDTRIRTSTKLAQKRKKMYDIQDNRTRRTELPHLLNLNQNRQLSNIVAYFCREGQLRVVKSNADPPPDEDAGDIVLNGLSIMPQHCIIKNTGTTDGKVSIAAMPKAKVYVNGVAVSRKGVDLRHNDRVVLGQHIFFRFHHPVQQKMSKASVAALEAAGETDPMVVFDHKFCQMEMSASSVQALAGGQKQSTPQDAELMKQRNKALKALKKEDMALKEQKRQSDRSKEQERLQYEDDCKEAEAKMEREVKILTEHMTEETDEGQKEEYAEQIEKKKADLEIAKKEFLKAYTDRVQEIEAKVSDLDVKIEEHKVKMKDLQQLHNAQNMDREMLQENLIETIPLVSEALAMAAEMNIKIQLEVLLRSAQGGRGDDSVHTEVCVKCVDARSTSIIWARSVFIERIYEMREMYNAWTKVMTENPKAKFRTPSDEDNPFVLSSEGPQNLGHARIYLQPNYFLLPIKVDTPIIDFTGAQQGMMKVCILPIPRHENSDSDMSDSDDDDGGGGGGGRSASPAATTTPQKSVREDEQDEFFFEEDDVSRLIRKPLAIRVEVSKLMGIPHNYTSKVHVRYRFFPDGDDDGDQEEWVSEYCPGEPTENPPLNHRRLIEFDSITPPLIEYLKNGCVEINVWGQSPSDEQKSRMLASLTADGTPGDGDGGAAAGSSSGGSSGGGGDGAGGMVKAIDDAALKEILASVETGDGGGDGDNGANSNGGANMQQTIQLAEKIQALNNETEILRKEKEAVMAVMKKEAPSDYKRAKVETERVRKQEEMRQQLEQATEKVEKLSKKAEEADELKKRVKELKKRIKATGESGDKDKKGSSSGDGDKKGPSDEEVKKMKSQLKTNQKELGAKQEEIARLEKELEIAKSKTGCVIL